MVSFVSIFYQDFSSPLVDPTNCTETTRIEPSNRTITSEWSDCQRSIYVSNFDQYGQWFLSLSSNFLCSLHIVSFPPYNHHKSHLCLDFVQTRFIFLPPPPHLFHGWVFKYIEFWSFGLLDLLSLGIWVIRSIEFWLFGLLDILTFGCWVLKFAYFS